MEEQKDQTAATSQRPAFLAVLCVLTWIFRGISLLFIIIGLIAASVLGAWISKLGIGGIGTGVLWSIIFLILNVAVFYGAIMMWKMKKMGFYIYLGAIVILFFLPLFYGAFGFVWWRFLIFTALFPVLYALNLKHLK